MSWDPLGLHTLRDDWVAAPEVTSEEIRKEVIFTSSTHCSRGLTI